MNSNAGENKFVSGLTPASFLAGICALLVLSIVTQFGEVILNAGFLTEHAIPLPLIWVFLFLLIIVGTVFSVSKVLLLNRAERLCVMYALLIAAPLMTQGFWHRIVAVISTNPRGGDFEKMDAFNDKLWPHGDNVVERFFDKSRGAELVFAGNHDWQKVEFDKGLTAELPTLTNSADSETSTIRMKIPLQGDGAILKMGEPHMVSVLARAEGLGPDSRYFCRLYGDESTEFAEVFNSNAPAKKTFIHQTGFMRLGAYGTKLPVNAKSYVYLEFGLKGSGTVQFFDPKLFSVAALEGVFKGRLIVSEKDVANVPESDRATLIIKPDNLISWAGFKYFIAGYIPVKDWIVPMFAWTSFIMLILVGTLAIGAIMRKQWTENERYSLPMARIPEALVDPQAFGDGRSIWKNGLVWAGIATGLVYVVARAASFYNPSFPDVSMKVNLKTYFASPDWGGMFEGNRLEVNLVFLSICIFMELNILFSLVVGFWIFRLQRWVGELTRWNVNPNYPYTFDQQIVAYLTYGLMILFLARRYLAQVIKAAITGEKRFSAGEPVSYRAACITLIGVFIGCAVWAKWMGIGVPGMMLFFSYLLLVGFVSAKFRAEAGFPWGYHAPGNFAILMTLFGGIPLFGPSAVLFCYVASFFLAPTVFFLIPGAQVELLELGTRWHIRGRQLVTVAILGVLGGILIGGWVFLSTSYSQGGETFRYGWAYQTKPWYFFSFNAQLQAATNQLTPASAATASGIDPVWYAYAFSAIGTILITVLRQMFAGFPFHPIGFILGTTAGAGGFIDYVWGSALAAFVIRGVVLWMGGAAVVRQKLQPYFVGVFLGACVAELLCGIYGTYLRSLGLEEIFNALLP